LADNSYSKQSQLARTFGVSRTSENLRAFLRLTMPKTIEQSKSERFGKCAMPTCFAYGSENHPLDLHHVLPRSQSKERIDDFTNHLYLCGDFFPKNHHKGIHGERTPGWADWKQLGIFDDSIPEDAEPPRAATDEDIRRLLQYASQDVIVAGLLRSRPAAAIEYLLARGNISFTYIPDSIQYSYIKEQFRERNVWNPLKRIYPKIP